MVSNYHLNCLWRPLIKLVTFSGNTSRRSNKIYCTRVCLQIYFSYLVTDQPIDELWTYFCDVFIVELSCMQLIVYKLNWHSARNDSYGLSFYYYTSTITILLLPLPLLKFITNTKHVNSSFEHIFSFSDYWIQ